MLHIVGTCEKRIFGLRPAERLQRQLKGRPDLELVAHASAVMSDATLDWLAENRGTIVASREHRPLAVAIDRDAVECAKDAIGGTAANLPVVVPSGDQFVRNLRRRVELRADSLEDDSVLAVEQALFRDVYKGVTDLVTKYAWPWPAFHVTRAASRLGITPNMVTWVGFVLVLVAGWLFYQGELAAGLAAAWLMTFFDTVDGKLARVTSTSSAFGNLLDHGTDLIHPPIWWYCLAHGLSLYDPGRAPQLWDAFWVILGCYVAGRIMEFAFYPMFGFNQYIWRPFDSWFRLIISRRNIILLIMSAGLLARLGTEAFLVCAVWSAISAAIQLIRIGQGYFSRPITSWLY